MTDDGLYSITPYPVSLLDMERQKDHLIHVHDRLFWRLSSRGLMPVEIPRLIKDVFNIIRDGGHFTVSALNEDLELLGWEKRVMDSRSFELILFILETEYGFEVKRHPLH